MKIAITGDLYRPGAEGNIIWLYTALRQFFPLADLVRARPLPWEEWAIHRNLCVDDYRTLFWEYDLVIGFELPPALQAACRARWVNIDLHPYRWALPQWSVLGGFDIHFQSKTPVFPTLTKPKRPPTETCFTTQVSSDATLLNGAYLILPEHKMAEITAKLAGYEKVWIVPHPLEAKGPWVSALLTMPNAALWTRSAYEAMEEMESMWTISSSTGHEAPFFKCVPHFLGVPRRYSDPQDITDPKMWETVMEHWEITWPGRVT